MTNTLVDAATSLIGVRFVDNGRNPAVGLDCVGVIVAACQLANIPIKDSTEYNYTGSHGLLVQELDKQFRRVTRKPMRGDIVAFKTSSTGHVGIMEDTEFMVHARIQNRVVKREKVHRAWRRILSGVWET